MIYIFKKDIFGVSSKMKDKGYNLHEVEEIKIKFIDQQFYNAFYQSTLDFFHIMKLFLIRGWNICLFELLILLKCLFVCVEKFWQDLYKFLEFKIFTMDKDLEVV
jgi:polyferredoxin